VVPRGGPRLRGGGGGGGGAMGTWGEGSTVRVGAFKHTEVLCLTQRSRSTHGYLCIALSISLGWG
jgi:hypothetical protein